MESNNNAIKEHHIILIDKPIKKAFELNCETVILGRGKSADILIESHVISRVHATFIRTIDSESQKFNYRIIDGSSKNNPSKNGILVNNKRCLVHLLKHGDILSFGNTINGIYLRVELDDKRFKKYLSIILECNEINNHEFKEIDLMTQMFCQTNSYVSDSDSTSIMMGGL